MHLFYLRGRDRGREKVGAKGKDGKEESRDREKLAQCWFTPQAPTMAGAGMRLKLAAGNSIQGLRVDDRDPPTRAITLLPPSA